MFIYVPVKEMNVIDVYEINHIHLSLTTIFHFGTRLNIVFFFLSSTVNRRRSNCVKEIERLKKNREERR